MRNKYRPSIKYFLIDISNDEKFHWNSYRVLEEGSHFYVNNDLYLAKFRECFEPCKMSDSGNCWFVEKIKE